MSELRAKDLLQAKALGCLDPDEETTFAKLINEDKDFPWEEYGNYQNIVSHLPIMLDAEVPDEFVKQKVTAKIAEIMNLKKVQEVPQEIPEDTTEKNQDISLDKLEGDVEIQSEDNIIEVDEEKELEEEPVKKGISFKQHGVLESHLGGNIGPTKNRGVEQEVQKKKSTSPSTSTKEPNRKGVKSHISKSPVYIEPSAKDDSRKGNLIAIILFIIAMIFIIVVYFKLSSDIRDNKNEIEELKEQLYSEVTSKYSATSIGFLEEVSYQIEHLFLYS